MFIIRIENEKGEIEVMYYKVSPVIIAVLIVAIVVMAGLGIAIVTSKSKVNSPKEQEIQSSDIVPVLELSANTEEENQENVTISAVATTEDSQGIYSITLPDGSTNRSDKASYVVNQNGNYTFKVKGNNGKTSSLTIEVNNIREASASEPYIPKGFSHVEGEVENGFVIQDSYGNEFVWIPVETGKLTRNRMLDDDYEETNNTATALVNSVAKNYGFYIGRYEASVYEKNGQKVAATLPNKTPWTNITYPDAAEASIKATSVFGYEGYQTAILNSYAWDTTLAWIDQNFESYSSNTSYGNYSGTIRNTGTTESDRKNNICDMAGNVREWTTEIYKNKAEAAKTSKKKKKNATNEELLSETVYYRVVRGGGANISRTASSYNGNKENMTDEYWGFRVILYQ